MQHRAHLIGSPLGANPLDSILNVIPTRSPAWHAARGTFNANDFRRWCQTIESDKTLPQPIVKPERQLGAPWMDNFIAQRASVALCEDCNRRYDKWWTHYDYEPRNFSELTDCDGCSKRLVICTGFYSALQR